MRNLYKNACIVAVCTICLIFVISCKMEPTTMEVRANSLESTYNSVKGSSDKAMICKTECVDWNGHVCLAEVSKCFYTNLFKEEI